MNTVHIKASSEYDVRIASGLLSSIGEAAAILTKAQKIAVVTDSNVFPLYGKTTIDSLSEKGFEPAVFVFPAGETGKNGENYLSLLNFLAENGLARSDCLIALGGGVAGDLAGFAAATYLRGISFIQVPTTLLAAVDSSVGGKTAIDLPAGKNLAGAFYQPRLVLCDTDTLRTLPEKIFRDGCAEVIKYAVLYDPVLFSHLRKEGPDFDRESVISRCVELKRDVIAKDEFDIGERMKLNLGHTIGHAIEACSQFKISHGEAVAAGMAIITRASRKAGICDTNAEQEILMALEIFGLPTSCPYNPEELCRRVMSDKKRRGDIVNLIVPRSVGDCVIRPTPINEIQSFIKAGL